MPASSRERGLLFGLTALQFNFVTRDRLLEVAAPWMADARGDLGAILLERGFIKPDQHAAVAAMVAAQLNSHGGDGKASLASAPLDATLRATLRALDPSARAPEPPPPGGAARYRLGTELGRGGLGRVVEAFDPELKRDVAIKLVLDTLAPDVRERFIREAELTARLEHPNIVPVHDFGALENGGKRELFLCMKRVRGRDLGKLLEAMVRGDRPSKRAYTRARLLRIFQDICLGVAFAHDRGVVHRDLKPSNIMIGDYGETLIVDWGLARILCGDAPPLSDSQKAAGGNSSAIALTLQGEIVGTPMYMSPEQAEGRAQDVDTRSDIWALGAILYEILTFRPPFEGKTVDEILSKVKSGRITPPSEVLPPRATPPATDVGRTVIAAPSTRSFREPVPPELDAICMKALALRKEERFQSAMELHDDIQLYLEGVREKERRARMVREALKQADQSMKEFARLREDAESASLRAEQIGQSIPFGADRFPYWAEQDRAAELMREAARACSRVESAIAGALASDPEDPGARRARAELSWNAFCRAEAAGDESAMIIERTVVAEYGGEAFSDRLNGEGSVTLETVSYACGCLRNGRVVAPEELWDGNTHLLSGRAIGAPEADCLRELEPSGPATLRVHSLRCNPLDAPGAEVWGWIYQKDTRLLVPSTPEGVVPGRESGSPDPACLDGVFSDSPFRPRGPGVYLGKTPVRAATLPAGSWLFLVVAPGKHPLRVTSEVRRGEDTRVRVTLWDLADVPEGYVPVPEGSFPLASGTGLSWVQRRLPAFFMKRFPVTCAEYAAFLQSVGEQDEMLATQLQPRLSGLTFWPGPPFRVPTSEWLSSATPELRAQARILTGITANWEETWPVVCVTWKHVLRYISWEGQRTGLVCVLVGDMEYLRAGRGSDRRPFPWGLDWSPGWANSNAARPGRTQPARVDEFPHDESPFGIRGLGGNSRTWSRHAPPGVPHWRFICGGGWWAGADRANLAHRNGGLPETSDFQLGIRPVILPFTFS